MVPPPTPKTHQDVLLSLCRDPVLPFVSILWLREYVIWGFGDADTAGFVPTAPGYSATVENSMVVEIVAENTRFITNKRGKHDVFFLPSYTHRTRQMVQMIFGTCLRSKDSLPSSRDE